MATKQFRFDLYFYSDGKTWPKVEINYEGRADTIIKVYNCEFTREQIADVFRKILNDHIGVINDMRGKDG